MIEIGKTNNPPNLVSSLACFFIVSATFTAQGFALDIDMVGVPP